MQNARNTQPPSEAEADALRRASEPPANESNEPNEANQPSGIGYRPADFEHSVRVDASGKATAGHGRVQEMAAITAYAWNVCDLIGERLGFGPVVAFEAQRQPGAYFMYRDADQAIAVIPRRHVDLQPLRNRLNL